MIERDLMQRAERPARATAQAAIVSLEASRTNPG